MRKEAAVSPVGGVIWPRGSLLSGRVYKVTDESGFFTPIFTGQGAPQQGYEPWAGLEVRTWSVNDLFPIPFPGGSAVTQADGSFTINQTPPNPVLGDGGVGTPSDIRFALVVSEGSFPFRPLYRSDLSLSVAAAETTELDIWLLPETVDVKDGISAGSVSSLLQGSGLPGNTKITASSSGLAFSGSSSGADVEFGLSITPDTSFNLNTFLDLGLTSWHIHVGWPADWCTNADNILIQIGEGLQSAAASMNASVLTRMETIFAEDEGLPDPATNPSIAALIKKFLTSDVSVTFMDVTYPTQHTWALSNKTDSTVVITGDLCVGYPRSLSSDPSRLPVFEPLRLSKLFRPVRI
jgi:hypothetical protein